MIREALKLLFLITAYNFILHYLSGFLPFDLFPQNLEDILIVLSIVSALYLAWLFGYREKTVIWLAYVSFFQVVGLSLVRENYTLMTQFIPPLLMTVLLIWLFESPVEKRTKEIEENRERLEEELSRNQEELSRLTEQINLLKELTEGLSKEKEAIERQLEKLKEEESIERQNLEREKEELSKKLVENQKKIQEYMDRLERVTRVNRELFEMLEVMQEKEPKGGKEELSRLRQERKRLSKELIQLQELLEELSQENIELNKKYEELRQVLLKENKEKELLKLEIENLKRYSESTKDIYKEVFDIFFDNIEFDERAVKEFIELNYEAKKEFIKELFLLNMKDYEDKFENMKGYKNVFKLKPAGGRIYFTFGDNKRWRVLGILWGEDNKTKNRYVKELLVKYKD
uniref:CARD domain-containing protein n=1 Tax=Hydrogenobacter sp. TaxID=2152829 RepID=A0A7C2ZNJ6_9AQUI